VRREISNILPDFRRMFLFLRRMSFDLFNGKKRVEVLEIYSVTKEFYSVENFMNKT
jgi:hypothetical protein